MSDVGSSSTDNVAEQALLSNANSGKAIDTLRRQMHKLQSRVDVLERQLAAIMTYNANTFAGATAAAAAAGGGGGGGAAGMGQSTLPLPFAMRGAGGFAFGTASPTHTPTMAMPHAAAAAGGGAGGLAFMPTMSPNIPQPSSPQQQQQQQQHVAAMAAFPSPMLPVNMLPPPPPLQQQQQQQQPLATTANSNSSNSNTTTPSLLPTVVSNNNNNNHAATATTDEAGAAVTASGNKQLESDMARLGLHAGNGSAQPLQTKQSTSSLGGMYNNSNAAAAASFVQPPTQQQQQQQRDEAILAMLSGQPTPNMTPTDYSPIFPSVATLQQQQQQQQQQQGAADDALTAAAGSGMLSVPMPSAGAGNGGNTFVDPTALKHGISHNAAAAASTFATLPLPGRPQPQQQQHGSGGVAGNTGMTLPPPTQQQQQQQHMASMMGMAPGFANMYNIVNNNNNGGGVAGGAGSPPCMMHSGNLATPTTGNVPHGLDMGHAAAMLNGSNNNNNNNRAAAVPGMQTIVMPPGMQPFFGLHSPVTAGVGFGGGVGVGPAGMMMPAAAAAGGFMLNSNNNGNVIMGGGAGGGNNNAALFAMANQQAMPTTVTLDPARANNEALDRVCMQQWLKEVCLKGCKNISNFTPLMRLRNLWKLNLQGCSQYVDDTVVLMVGVHNRRLSRLNLCGCERITDAAPLSHLSFLFDLNLSGCPIGNASLEAISRSCLQLSRLAINSCPQLTDIRCLANLKELKLLYCRYSGKIDPDSISVVLNAIGGSLLTLNVDGINFAQLDLTQLPPVMALKNLNIKDNAEVTDLFWLTSLPGADKTFASLEMLDAEGCTALSQLGHIAALPALKTLRLSHTAITQAELTQLASCPALTTLYIDHCVNLTNVECLVSVATLAKVYVDQRFATSSSSGGVGGSCSCSTSNGIAALQQTGHIDIVYAAPANNNNSSGGGGGGSSYGGNSAASLYAVGVLGAFSPTASPTNAFVPALPCGNNNSGSGGGSCSNAVGSNSLSPGSVVSTSGSSHDVTAATHTTAAA